jgi:hypothetical protein
LQPICKGIFNHRIDLSQLPAGARHAPGRPTNREFRHALMLPLSKGCGWLLAEQSAIFGGKPAQLPEALASRRHRHSQRLRGAKSQSPMHRLQPTELEVAQWIHPELVGAVSAQETIRNTQRVTDCSYAPIAERLDRQEFFKTVHQLVPSPSHRRVLIRRCC